MENKQKNEQGKQKVNKTSEKKSEQQAKEETQPCSVCGKPASLQCPKCKQLKLSPTFFCGTKCFRGNWSTHKKIHEQEKARRAFKPPPFRYSGSLRPHYVTPMRSVPSHISKPDYHLSGSPTSELKVKGSNKIHINSAAEIKGIREACRLGREILDIAGNMVRPGVTPEQIDERVHNETVARNAYPSPLNYMFFPKSCCTSVNEIICHGVPDTRPLEEGDIINIDITVFKDGYHGDLNETFLVGEVESKYKKLIKATYESLMQAIEAVRPGVACRDFGPIISKHVSKHGYQVVKTYCGHGIGSLFHCSPNIPHYKRNKAVGILRPGMTFTIEPMINMGSSEDMTWPDDWTSSTIDGKRSAQFEHTMLVTETGVEVLTARTANSRPLWWEVPGAMEEYEQQEAKIAKEREAKRQAEDRAFFQEQPKDAPTASGNAKTKKKRKRKKKKKR